MGKIIIRRVIKEDLPYVVDIQIDGWRTAYRNIIDDDFLDSLDKNVILERRKKDYKDDGFIVALEDNEIIGFSRYIFSNKYSVEYKNVDCELLAIYVKTDKKHCGIGKIMFQYVIDEFLKHKKETMILWCLKENWPARKFYERMNGNIIGEHDITLGNKDYPEVGYQYSIIKNK